MMENKFYVISSLKEGDIVNINDVNKFKTKHFNEFARVLSITNKSCNKYTIAKNNFKKETQFLLVDFPQNHEYAITHLITNAIDVNDINRIKDRLAEKHPYDTITMRKLKKQFQFKIIKLPIISINN
jgi:hypothetical protein